MNVTTLYIVVFASYFILILTIALRAALSERHARVGILACLVMNAPRPLVTAMVGLLDFYKQYESLMFSGGVNRKWCLYLIMGLPSILVSASAAAQAQPREATPAIVNPVLRSSFSQTISLDGKWDFATDPGKKGQDQQWYRPDVPLPSKRDIQVPGCWEAQGVGEPGYSQPPAIRMAWEVANRPIFANYHGSAWYRKTITVPDNWQGNRIWIKFGGSTRPAGYG